ncbi:hypothetical protein [Saccharopolyspora sp. ASAGF58]|uniref:hypothetical protein n=1 Tax=Saccharopolyspora sp. ASAGF58 TaxID=2719023 RepID=UPI00143FBDE5|nr:hypothetical protein [Saccharopolyspora sp. ASAGF58]QIZ37008.1 hypothetical protein FDZ84_23140 [Saccharopolyspora sp. ASAGF58]
MRTVSETNRPRTLFILRWQDGEDWGHLSMVTHAAKPVFLGFVNRAMHPAFHALSSDCSIGADGFREVWFTGCFSHATHAPR